MGRVAPSRPRSRTGWSRSRHVRDDILVVDDPVDACRATTHLLRLRSFVVEAAHTGRQALEEAPRVILLDITLPDMDGHAVLVELRAHAALAAVRVIGLSGHTAPEAAERALAAGFEAYLHKPLDLQELLRVISTLDERL